MRAIISTYDRLKASGLKMALASVVEIQESSYRRVGARMLVCENGQWTGGISGGCLEGDALKKAKHAIYNDQPTITVYNTLEDDEHQIGVGLGCNGLIKVFFQPINPDDTHNEVELLRTAVQENQSAVLLKVIQSTDSNINGQSYLLKEERPPKTVFGMPYAVISEAIEQVRVKRRPQIALLGQASAETKVLLEYLRPETRLVIIGDNYDVISVVNVAQNLGWELYSVGRKRKLSKPIYTACKAVYEYESFEEIPIDEFTAIVLMTHDYDKDKLLIPKILEKNPPYIGMLGPKKRLKKLSVDLGVNLEAIVHFHSPVGLDIGAETPEEIAVAVAAEVISVFRRRAGGFLRERGGTIHARIE